MSKLEDLKNLVADMFKNAEDKTAIEQLAHINNTIDEAQKEQDELVNKNGELIKSYKDLIQHTSFKDEHKPQDPVGGSSLSFEDALKDYMSKTK